MQGAMRAVACAALVMTMAATAQADDVDAAKRHFAQGTKFFDLTLYDKAIEEYMAAYDAKPDPALLYNIAQAHKLAGRPEKALRFYKTYLTRVPEAPNASEVAAKIAELQKAIDQQHKAQAMPPDHVKALDSVPSPPPTTTPPATPPPAVATTPADTRGGRRTRQIAGATVAAVGVAALGVGIGLSVVAKQQADQLSSLDAQHGVYDPGKDSTGRALGVAGPALLAVGGAAILAGGVVFILGRRAARPASLASAR